MKKAVFIILVMASGVIYAGSIKEKYMDTFDKIDKAAVSEETQSRILEENVNRALKMTLLEKYNLCDYQKAQIGKEGFEVSELNRNLIYVQYNDFVGYYLFGTDPRKFLQAPETSNVLLQPGSKIIRSYDKECSSNSSISSVTGPQR